MDMNSVYGLTSGKFLEPICAVDNQFIRQLAHLAEQQAKELKVVSFVLKDKVNNRGEIALKGVRPSEKSVIDLCKLTPLVGAYGSKNLLEEIAQYRASGLNFSEVHDTWWKENAEALMLDYLLASCLCYVEVFDSSAKVEKFFATRNRFIAGSLAGIEPAATAKYTSYLQTFSVNYQTKQLKVLKLTSNKTGFKISQPRSFLDFNKSIKVTPLFLMTSFVDGVSEVLQNNIVKFTYIKDNLTEREMVSTLSPQIMLKYYDQEYVQTAMASTGVALNRGYVKMPELGLSKYDHSGVRALNISRLTSVEVISEFDSSYIDVDFDMILPTFRETVDNLRDPRILNMIHEDLTGQPSQALSIPELKNTLISFVDGQYAIGTTTALRYIHSYMVSRAQVFALYNGGKRREFSMPGNSFNMGTVE